MGRRPLPGRDKKIMQGHRRDAFFAAMRRKGGVARLPNEAPEGVAVADEEPLEALATREGATENETEPAQGEEQVNPTPEEDETNPPTKAE